MMCPLQLVYESMCMLTYVRFMNLLNRNTTYYNDVSQQGTVLTLCPLYPEG